MVEVSWQAGYTMWPATSRIIDREGRLYGVLGFDGHNGTGPLSTFIGRIRYDLYIASAMILFSGSGSRCPTVIPVKGGTARAGGPSSMQNGPRFPACLNIDVYPTMQMSVRMHLVPDGAANRRTGRFPHLQRAGPSRPSESLLEAGHCLLIAFSHGTFKSLKLGFTSFRVVPHPRTIKAHRQLGR
ncbi:hypothetical protein V1478_008308 [Vespula squamosa]|uniref:Uncharacterized protein n=1 Tax=Vespula squamosa TaxID=30214 RepID=A0ABD2B0A7_VESSQ